MVLIKRPLGTEGEFTIEIVKGELITRLTHKHVSGSTNLESRENFKYFLEQAKTLIPGPYDDAVFDVLAAAAEKVE